MIRLPCKKCISYAICRSRYATIMTSDLTTVYNPESGIPMEDVNVSGYARYQIAEQCIILSKYFYRKNSYKYIQFAVNVLNIPITISFNMRIYHRVLISKFKRYIFDSFYRKGII